jgi:hypothetical protein
MIHTNKRKLNLLLFFAACIFISVAATKPSTSLNIKKVSENDTGIFKNLKILPKNISKDSLDHVMHNFTASLGVRCNFCHVFNNGKMDFVSDDKEEKNIARYMMTMTAGINKTYFNSENSTMPDTINVVRCFTCHRGSPHPDEASMGMQNGNTPPPQMQGQGDSSHKIPPPPPPNQ